MMRKIKNALKGASRILKRIKLEFNFYRYSAGGKYIFILLLPTIEVGIDRQLEERYTSSDGTSFGGVVEFSIGISWLVFGAHVTLIYEKE